MGARSSNSRLRRWKKRAGNYDLVAPTPDVLVLLDELDRRAPLHLLG